VVACLRGQVEEGELGLRVQVDVHPGAGHVVVTATGDADRAAAGSLAAVLDVLARAPVRSVVLDLERADAAPPALEALEEAIDDRGVSDRVTLTVRGRS
jgi:hypothetical protein